MFSGPVPIPFVEVVWDDAESSNGWEYELKVKPALVLTAGFLVSETEDHIVIASTVSPDKDGTVHHNCRLQIPTKMVLSRRTL